MMRVGLGGDPPPDPLGDGDGEEAAEGHRRSSTSCAMRRAAISQ